MLGEDVCFTRRILMAHLVLGILVVILIAAHDLLFWALGVGSWYLLTILPLHGMMSSNSLSRHLLGFLFLLFSSGGVFFLTQVEPTLLASQSALIHADFMPFWLGALNLLYALAGACLVMHHKVRKAVSIGFSLW